MLRTTDLATANPQDLWEACRTGEWDRSTASLCKGFTQTNLAILPQADAFDFLRFCQRNPKPCPLIEVTEPGSPEPKLTAAGADLRTDLPRYRVYRRGQLVEECTDIRGLWRNDFVAFLIGVVSLSNMLCSKLAYRCVTSNWWSMGPCSVRTFAALPPDDSADRWSSPCARSLLIWSHWRLLSQSGVRRFMEHPSM